MRLSIIFVLLFWPAALLAAGGPVSYQVEGKTYEGYFVSPRPDAPLLVLVHDWDGLTEYEVKRADMLADLGYAVFAIDLFGAGIRPTQMEERKRLTGELYADRGKMRALLDAGLSTAKKQSARTDRVIAFGYCFGGSAVLELARSGAALAGFVSFHGGLATPEGQNYSAAKGSILILHGTADSSVSMTEFAGLASELEKAGVKHEMTTYAGAPHAFTVFGSDRYREDADRKSWQRFTAYLKETLP